MSCFKLTKPEAELHRLKEEYRKLLRRERRLQKLVRQLEALLAREQRRRECEELPTIRL
jgi:hypothetical protein